MFTIVYSHGYGYSVIVSLTLGGSVKAVSSSFHSNQTLCFSPLYTNNNHQIQGHTRPYFSSGKEKGIVIVVFFRLDEFAVKTMIGFQSREIMKLGIAVPLWSLFPLETMDMFSLYPPLMR